MRYTDDCRPVAEVLEPRIFLSASSLLQSAFASAETMAIAPVDNVTVAGELVPGDVQMYAVTATATGTLTFNMQADGSALDPFLNIYNTAGRRLASNDNAARGTLDSRVTLKVKVGQAFYVSASGQNGSAGSYSLSVQSNPTDDYGNKPEVAKAVGLAMWKTTSVSGLVNYDGDADIFSFIAPTTGTIRVSGSPTGRSNSLSAGLSAYDGANMAMTPADGLAAGVGSLAFDVTAGERYYIRVSGEDGTSGAYKISLYEQLLPEILSLSPLDTVITSGEVPVGSSQLYYVTAAATGTLTFDMQADGSALDPFLNIYSTTGKRLASNDNAARGTLNSRVTLKVTAGQSFIICASGSHGTTGAFVLTARSNPTDDYGNTLDNPKNVTVNTSQTTGVNGTINYTGDADVFTFIAPTTGTVSVTEYATGKNNSLSAAVYDYDGPRSEIASAANGAAAGAALTFDVRPRVSH